MDRSTVVLLIVLVSLIAIAAIVTFALALQEDPGAEEEKTTLVRESHGGKNRVHPPVAEDENLRAVNSDSDGAPHQTAGQRKDDWTGDGRDRHFRDSLFADGFAKMKRGEYRAGLEALQMASGAEHLPAPSEYRLETGLMALEPIVKAARAGGRGGMSADPAALVFVGAEAEFRGFIERKTGESPDYRIDGYANHLGEAISYYRTAESMGYPVAVERIEALRLRLGDPDFSTVETVFNNAIARTIAHQDSVAREIRRSHGIPEP